MLPFYIANRGVTDASKATGFVYFPKNNQICHVKLESNTDLTELSKGIIKRTVNKTVPTLVLTKDGVESREVIQLRNLNENDDVHSLLLTVLLKIYTRRILIVGNSWEVNAKMSTGFFKGISGGTSKAGKAAEGNKRQKTAPESEFPNDSKYVDPNRKSKSILGYVAGEGFTDDTRMMHITKGRAYFNELQVHVKLEDPYVFGAALAEKTKHARYDQIYGTVHYCAKLWEKWYTKVLPTDALESVKKLGSASNKLPNHAPLFNANWRKDY